MAQDGSNNQESMAAVASSSGSMAPPEPRPPPATTAVPDFLRKVHAQRQRTLRGEGEASSSDELEESVEELLSGPKDSVTMFGCTAGSCGSRSRFQFDMSAGGDLLDMLAREVTARQNASSSSAGPSMGESSHRHEIHRELDEFLDDALRREGSQATPPFRARQAWLPPQDDEAREKSEASYAARPDAEELEQARHEARDLRAQVEHLVSVQKDALQAQERAQAERDAAHAQLAPLRQRAAESEVELQAAELEVWSLSQRLGDLQKEVGVLERAAQEPLDAAFRKATDLEEQLDVQTFEAQKLRGEKDALQSLSSTELSALADVLMDSLRRVQQEHLRKLERQNDELMCIACLTERKTVVLQPCNHLTMCVSCFHQCRNTCPQCRAVVRGHLVIYT